MLKFSQFLYFLKSSRFLKIAAKAFEAGKFLNILRFLRLLRFSYKNVSYKKTCSCFTTCLKK